MTIECYYDDYFKIINSYSPKMFDNDQYIEELVKKRGAKFFDFASERLCTDIEFIKKMVEINYKILYWIPERMEILDNESLFKYLWTVSLPSLLYASKRLRNHLEKQYRDYIRTYISITFENFLLNINPNITINIYRNDDWLFNYLPSN